MDEVNGWGWQHATDQQRIDLAEKILDHAFDVIRPQGILIVQAFLAQAISSAALFQLEMGLLDVVRAIGRLIMQAVVQSLEPDTAVTLPRNVWFECGGYRRRSDRTFNRSIATRFGNITLRRTGYRSWVRGEETIFPLEQMLGLTQNVSPAMLSWIGQITAAAGMSQQTTIRMIREQTTVPLGVKRLRACTKVLADRLEPLRQTCQVDALLSMLETAKHSSGSRKPVLCVGRDGITLRQRASYFEVATAGTVSVYDRAGKRLGTVYLAHPPEPGQASMDQMITSLLEELFERWTGPLPRLAYVTDSGSNEVDYFRRVLKTMKHPVTGSPLSWTRVADFYHVSERVWAIADALFTQAEQQQAAAWARRMLKKLKRPSGASRVLHSAAALLSRRKLGKARLKNYRKAYRYLQKRTAYLKYHDYKKLHIPLGSGVTEAACKTIFTQRLKLSGQRWTHEGVGRILTLRTILLSNTWDATYHANLSHNQPTIRTYTKKPPATAKLTPQITP